MADVVIFRRWNDTGDIVAIFPEQPADDQGRYCLAYDKLGQHIAAEYEQVMQHTTPISAQEYERFAHELTLLGYDLQPINEATEQHHERRQTAARKS